MTRSFSPVLRANVRFSAGPAHFHVNVWFNDANDIDRFIDALVELRDTANDDFDHIHLQHYDMAPGYVAGLAEVNFFRPGRKPTPLELELLDTASQWLSEQRKNTE